MMKPTPIIIGFAAGAICSFAAMSMTNDNTMRKLKRKTTRTMRTIGNVASDIADIVR